MSASFPFIFYKISSSLSEDYYHLNSQNQKPNWNSFFIYENSPAKTINCVHKCQKFKGNNSMQRCDLRQLHFHLYFVRYPHHCQRITIKISNKSQIRIRFLLVRISPQRKHIVYINFRIQVKQLIKVNIFQLNQ